ncbi:MAG: Rieske 2Fe-2S domain-containing protein [Dehalococcoidia bacterium]|nr:Rieske 2Fe-2S domain-containing protein [Dehalococcoidia bacterium]
MTSDAALPYDRAATGFRNYWYPALGEREVGRHPRRMILLGEPIAFVRRGAKVYAVQDECPHRGARMSLGKDEFPGTDTLACRFHGWTFDLRNGACVAALTDGPDSPVVGKVRIRTFPTEQRKGIVWVWMGRGAPVPLEEDVPYLLLRDDAMVKYRRRVVYGNWRYHAEGSGGGHFQMLHKDSLALLMVELFAANQGADPYWGQEGPDGEYLIERVGPPVLRGDFPGLGEWPPKRPWRLFRPNMEQALPDPKRFRHGVETITAMRLPGYLRVRNFPLPDAIYFEWYTAIDADHYQYFQASCHWPRNPLQWAWINALYHLWARPVRKGRFNDQDKAMVRDGTDRAKRSGLHAPTPLYRPDSFPLAFREMCNRYARGEGLEDAERQGRGGPVELRLVEAGEG